jgi:hypothetical protein
MPLNSLWYRLEPAVPRRVLYVAAALAWELAGLILAVRAFFWLRELGLTALAYAAPALLAGWAKGRWVFGRVADKNIARIEALSPQKKRICVFAFQALESYLLVLVMIGAGVLLRLSPLPRPILAAVYLAIGLGLIFGSFRYWRASFPKPD